ncbi:hypothetical protein AHiyo8_25710 [Arthrobacter sp. Hiyo8]|nr:hypothetical protein AHiyo8_25710 [Arthrobacter sp. Hiyo8]
MWPVPRTRDRPLFCAGLDQLELIRHDLAAVDDRPVGAAVHHRGGDRFAVEQQEFGRIADLDARAVCRALQASGGRVEDAGAAYGGDREAVLDEFVLAEAVGESELPGAVEHVRVAIGDQ